MSLQTVRTFVSYSRKNKDFVERLVIRLQNRCTVWWDQRLTPAEIWWLTILDEIEKCDCFVLILTSAYNGSAFCLAELDYALALGKPLLPVVPDRSVKFPPHVSHAQAAFIEGFSVSEAYGEIVAGVGGLRHDQYVKPDGNVPRPPEPTVSGQSQLSDLYADAAEALAIGNLALAERFYEQVVSRDRGELGRLAQEELDTLRKLRKCRSDYENIGRLAAQAGTLKAAINLWRVYRREDECGTDYDPNDYAHDPRFVVGTGPLPAPPALPVGVSGKPTFNRQHYLRLMLDSNRPPRERAEAGRKINDNGDPRAGVLDFYWGEDYWREVPAGEFIMGSDEQTDNRTRTVGLDRFAIAKFPVTYVQYKLFLDAPDGFPNPEWWRGLHGQGKAQHKAGAGDQKWKYPNHPAENVSWYDAVAFSRWLTAKLQAGQLPSASGEDFGVRAEITLPTEEQWEKAARGTEGRVYPWGDDYNVGYANLDESKVAGGTFLRQTTAVGLYPQGASPYGVLDMSGNVWEWCLNEYIGQAVNIQSNSRRVVRGGSGNTVPEGAVAAARTFAEIDSRSEYVGFRLVRLASF
jgi:formylglycine-generating enzyme required for sulfatase activity